MLVIEVAVESVGMQLLDANALPSSHVSPAARSLRGVTMSGVGLSEAPRNPPDPGPGLTRSSGSGSVFVHPCVLVLFHLLSSSLLVLFCSNKVIFFYSLPAFGVHACLFLFPLLGIFLFLSFLSKFNSLSVCGLLLMQPFVFTSMLHRTHERCKTRDSMVRRGDGTEPVWVVIYHHRFSIGK